MGKIDDLKIEDIDNMVGMFRVEDIAKNLGISRAYLNKFIKDKGYRFKHGVIGLTEIDKRKKIDVNLF